MMSPQRIYLLMILALSAMLGACSATKSVPDGEYLYTGAKVDYGENKKKATTKLTADVEDVLSPKPNSRILGVPIQLYLYELFDNGKEKGLFPWLRDKLGQPPVLFKNEYPEQVERLIANRLFNNGYFEGTADSEVVLKDKKAKVIYHLDFNDPYRIDTVSNRVQNLRIRLLLDEMKPSGNLKRGEVYTLAALKAEMAYIEKQLKEQGYYFFSKDYIKYQVDTTNGNRTVNLRQKLMKDAPPQDLKPAYISTIKVDPDYSGQDRAAIYQDQYEGLRFSFRELPKRFRLKPLADNILFRPGDRYHLRYHHNTLKRLVNLNSLSFVNVQFVRQSPASDSLNMFVTLTPRKPQSITGSLGIAYKNSQYFGPEVEIGYTHRNLFRGSENLRLRVFTNLNFPTGSTIGSFYENSGAEATLTLPRILLPGFGKRRYRELNRAVTKFNLLYERERVTVPLRDVADIIPFFGDFPTLEDGLAQDSSYAPFVGLNSLKFTFGYQWQRRPDIFHEFNPVGLGLQFSTIETPELKEFITLVYIVAGIVQGNLDQQIEPLLELEDMFYWNPDYIFVYDSRARAVKQHNFFYRGRVGLVGNYVIPDPRFEALNVEAFNSYFSQFDNDFRYFYIFGKKKHTLATRLVVDVSVPFGAELFLPFLNFYTVGGPNSVRAYALRELGPGTTRLGENENSLFLFAGKGDIHLESSIEYRHKLNKLFELAAFVDVGNVWLMQSEKPAANFRFDRFVRELGFGTGLGLRLNINPLVLRLDLAIPLTKPWLPEGERWVGNQIDIFSGVWRKENLQFNLSFGYPF